MVFQDPYSSLNPRLSVFDLIAEPLTNIEEYRKDKKKLDAKGAGDDGCRWAFQETD